LFCCFFLPKTSSPVFVHALFSFSQRSSNKSQGSCISWRTWYLFLIMMENCWAIQGPFRLMSCFFLFATGRTDLLSFSCNLPTRRWWSELASAPLIILTSNSVLLNFLDMQRWSIWWLFALFCVEKRILQLRAHVLHKYLLISPRYCSCHLNLVWPMLQLPILAFKSPIKMINSLCGRLMPSTFLSLS